jgi:phage anti-repressor protein/predicted GIY-YIG superfamily endonuclease
MNPETDDAKSFVKKLSTIPDDFIDELFEFYKPETLQTDFVLKLDAIAKWLKTSKYKLNQTLRASYKEHIDYIVKSNGDITKTTAKANNRKLYLLTPDCFKRLAMLSRSKNAEMLRTYFIEIESLFIRYKEQTMHGLEADIMRLERNQRGKKIPKAEGYIYIIKAATNMYKLGRTKDLTKRLKTYNTGLADDVEVVYLYKTKDIVAVENCVKSMLKEKQYRKYKEIYQTDAAIIKHFINSCGTMADDGVKLEYKLRGNSKIEGGYFFVISRDT